KNNDRTACDALWQILRLADFVKFAKLHPLPNENDLSMSNACLFIDQTKPKAAPPPVAAPEKPETEVNNKPDEYNRTKGDVK
ncbi:MAG: hypothetical protein LBP98_02480, partial [Tannerella sp.]|nr:hypothetical protein [Tannerella sp.]